MGGKDRGRGVNRLLDIVVEEVSLVDRAANKHRFLIVKRSDQMDETTTNPITVDLSFTITAALDRTVELLNLMAAVATFLNRNRWFALPRDPEDEDAETVRWEMDPDGDFQTRLDGPDDVRAFTCGFVVRGFDIDEGLPLDLGKEVAELGLDTDAISPGGTP